VPVTPQFWLKAKGAQLMAVQDAKELPKCHPFRPTLCYRGMDAPIHMAHGGAQNPDGCWLDGSHPDENHDPFSFSSFSRILSILMSSCLAFKAVAADSQQLQLQHLQHLLQEHNSVLSTLTTIK
jgi:hypothetical protein